jgi:hypothetical protein
MILVLINELKNRLLNRTSTNSFNLEPFVKQFYEDLKKNGIDVLWGRKTMESRSSTFLQELRDAIEASDHFISIIRVILRVLNSHGMLSFMLLQHSDISY